MNDIRITGRVGKSIGSLRYPALATVGSFLDHSATHIFVYHGYPGSIGVYGGNVIYNEIRGIIYRSALPGQSAINRFYVRLARIVNGIGAGGPDHVIANSFHFVHQKGRRKTQRLADPLRISGETYHYK